MWNRQGALAQLEDRSMTKDYFAAKQIALAFVLIAVPVALFSGYELYTVNSVQAAATGLGDLSNFKTIIADVRAFLDRGDMTGAAKRITDWETAWDQAETAIRPLNQAQWSNIDQASDGALSAVRKSTPDLAAAKAAVATLMAELNDPNKAP
jgi:hypothetical protein